MNASYLARSAYSDARSPVMTHRGVEYAAFERITARLQSAQTSATASFATRAVALHENRQLWTFLATDVAGVSNALPETLRAKIFYLSEFTRLHSRKVLSKEASLQPLIEINLSIMRGLRGQGAAA